MITAAAAAAKSLQSCPTLCNPVDGTHQAPPSLGFSRQEHWSGLPFPSPMHERENESEVAQSCLTLCDPMDCSLPGSSILGILQARVLEWVAIAFSQPLIIYEKIGSVRGKRTQDTPQRRNLEMNGQLLILVCYNPGTVF